MITSRQIGAMKHSIISRMKKIIAPKLRESGWVEGPIGKSKTLMIAGLPADKAKKDEDGDGKWGRSVDQFRDFDAIYAFTEKGVVSDIYLAAVVTEYSGMSLEDLIALERYLDEVKDLLN